MPAGQRCWEFGEFANFQYRFECPAARNFAAPRLTTTHHRLPILLKPFVILGLLVINVLPRTLLGNFPNLQAAPLKDNAKERERSILRNAQETYARAVFPGKKCSRYRAGSRINGKGFDNAIGTATEPKQTGTDVDVWILRALCLK